MVASILKNASQIWGFHRVKDIEVVHNRFCRFMLKLAKNLQVYHPPYFVVNLVIYLKICSFLRKHRIIKFWLHILYDKPNIVYDIYSLPVRFGALCGIRETGFQMFANYY